MLLIVKGAFYSYIKPNIKNQFWSNEQIKLNHIFFASKPSTEERDYFPLIK